jgi:ribosomal small subunit protein bTHX
MGKGDQRSRRGKIHRGTFGKRRPKPKLHKSGASPGTPAETGATTRERTKEAKVVKKQATE